METLPDEILLKVLDHCDPKSRLQAGSACRRLYALARDSVYWKGIGLGTSDVGRIKNVFKFLRISSDQFWKARLQLKRMELADVGARKLFTAASRGHKRKTLALLDVGAAPTPAAFHPALRRKWFSVLEVMLERGYLLRKRECEVAVAAGSPTATHWVIDRIGPFQPTSEMLETAGSRMCLALARCYGTTWGFDRAIRANSVPFAKACWKEGRRPTPGTLKRAQARNAAFFWVEKKISKRRKG